MLTCQVQVLGAASPALLKAGIFPCLLESVGKEERRGEGEVVETEELWVAFRVLLFFCLWYNGGGT